VSSLVAGVGACVVVAGLLGIAMGYGVVAFGVVALGCVMVIQAVRG
jgi:hypothetical protein